MRHRVSQPSGAIIGRNGAPIACGRAHFAAAGLIGLLALGLGGCATAIPLPSFMAREDRDITSSIRAPAAISPLSPSLDAEDWRRAKGALGVALDPQGNGLPVTWDNPKSGVKGIFRPVGEAKPVDDKVCRSFVAELSGSHPDKAMQGTACRDKAGEWTLGPVAPWKKA